MAAEKYATIVVALLCLASMCMAEDVQEGEKLETFTVDEPSFGRTFITTNGSNIITTPNFVVGVTLIFISLALLAGSAASAASVAAASTIAGGFGGPGKRSLDKRSLPEDGPMFNPAAILSSFSSLEKQFKNFDVTDVECRKRIICEIHQETGSDKQSRLGSLTNVILDTFNNISPDMDTDKYPFLKQYLEAANQGKTQRECSQVYNTCDYSVKNILRSLSF